MLFKPKYVYVVIGYEDLDSIWSDKYKAMKRKNKLKEIYEIYEVYRYPLDRLLTDKEMNNLKKELP